MKNWGKWQSIDWPMCQLDILCQIKHAHPSCFPSSFPADVPQWRWWRCTSSCLTSAFRSLSDRLHILSEVFLSSPACLMNTHLLICRVRETLQGPLLPSTLLNSITRARRATMWCFRRSSTSWIKLLKGEVVSGRSNNNACGSIL